MALNDLTYMSRIYVSFFMGYPRTVRRRRLLAGGTLNSDPTIATARERTTVSL